MILNLFVGVITGSITDAKTEVHMPSATPTRPNYAHATPTPLSVQLSAEKELSDRAAMHEELNQTQNTGKKIELQFKQILCSISDIHK